MADTSLPLNLGSGGANIATKERAPASSIYSEVILVGEAGSTNTAPVDATNGLAVDPKTLPPGAATETSVAASAAVAGVTSGAAVVSDSNGTIQQYLRGLVKMIAANITVVLGAGTAAIGKLAANAGVNIGDVNVTDAATRDNGKVDIAGFDVALPSGTNGIGKLTANSGVDIGDIDVTSLVSTRKNKYGTSNQALTITLASLTTTSRRESTVIDNTSNLFEDALVMVKVKSGASSTSATGYVEVFAYGTVDGGSSYSDTCTGSDAGITLTSPPNLRLIGVINVVANAVTYKSGPLSVASAFGGVLPDHWGIVIGNQSGGTLDGTGGSHSVVYQGVLGQTT